jgi:hypothetical protein
VLAIPYNFNNPDSHGAASSSWDHAHIARGERAVLKTSSSADDLTLVKGGMGQLASTTYGAAGQLTPLLLSFPQDAPTIEGDEP